MHEPLIRYPIVQYAYVVNDLDEGIRHWVETLGAGPFFVSRNHLGKEHILRRWRPQRPQGGEPRPGWRA